MADYQLSLTCGKIDDTLVHYTQYVCDPGEVDQGVAGNGETLKTYIDSIGTTKNATIRFRHNPADGNTTTYTLTTSETIPDNISLKTDPGVIINGAGTLTFNNPEQIITGKRQHIFGSSLTVVFTNPGTVYPEWWGVDGTADEIELQAAIDVNPGGKIDLDPAGYTFTSAGILIDDNNTELYSVSPCMITTAADIDVIALGPASDIRITRIGVTNSNGSATKANFKFNGKAKHCTIIRPVSIGGYYAFHFDQTAGTDPGGIFYNEIYQPWAYDSLNYLVYMNNTAVNENKFYGGLISQTVYREMLYLDGNNNLFFGVSFEDSFTDDYGKFTVRDNGLNRIEHCRFETDANGVWVDNTSATQYNGSMVYNNYWACLGVRVACEGGRVFTDTLGINMTFAGYIQGGSTGNTSIDGNSASGQKVVNLTSTTGFNVGNVVVIDPGNANEEWHTVTAVTVGVSITLNGNLDHTQGVGVTVTTKGKAYGMLGRPTDDASAVEFWSQGIKVFKMDNADSGAGMFVYDADDGALRQVTFGADDSGGGGYKVLRVEN